MKKKLLIALALLLSLHGRAQISFEATPDYGRLQDIIYDPFISNRLYAVSNAGNHLLVSTDNKASWKILYALPNPDAQLSQLKLIPGNKAVSFLCRNTGAAQDGIYIYNLDSNTIINHYVAPNPEDNPAIITYDVYNSAGTNVMIHTSFNDGFIGALRTKVFYTTNSGTAWSNIYDSENYFSIHVNNVAISPGNPDKLFLARGFSPGDVEGGLFISEDAGITWTEHLPGIMIDPISFNPQNSNDIIMGTGIAGNYHPENLYRSNDGGLTWNILPNNWNFINGYNNINKICFNPANPNNIVVLEEDVLAITNDGGQTWINTIYKQNDKNSYYAGLNASFNPFVNGEIVISTPYYPQFSTTGGLSLTQLLVPFYNVISVSTTSYNNESHIYYGSQGGRIYRNPTTGTSNNTQITNSFEFSPPKHYLVTDPLVQGRMFSFRGGGFMGGNLDVNTQNDTNHQTLMSVYADDMRALAIDPNNTSIVYVAFRNGEGSTLFKINFANPDDIITTEIITPGEDIMGLGNGVVTGIAISPVNSQTIYLVQRDKFYKSVDGGTTWEVKSNGIEIDPNYIIWDMKMSPFSENKFAIATQNGIFTTADNGDNWTQVYDQEVHKIKYSPINDGLIAAGIRRYGSLLYSLDNGTNWSIISPQQLNYIAAQDIDFNFIGNHIDAYIATPALGVVKYKISNLPLAIDSPELNTNDLKIYPNPASGIVNIHISNTETVKSVEIFSITGQKVYTGKQNTFDISNLGKGIYLIKVSTATGASITQKLIRS